MAAVAVQLIFAAASQATRRVAAHGGTERDARSRCDLRIHLGEPRPKGAQLLSWIATGLVATGALSMRRPRPWTALALNLASSVSTGWIAARAYRRQADLDLNREAEEFAKSVGEG